MQVLTGFLLTSLFLINLFFTTAPSFAAQEAPEFEYEDPRAQYTQQSHDQEYKEQEYQEFAQQDMEQAEEQVKELTRKQADDLGVLRINHGQAVVPWHPISVQERGGLAEVHPLGISVRGAYMVFHVAHTLSNNVIAFLNLKTNQIERKIRLRGVPGNDIFKGGELLCSPDNRTFALKMFNGPLVTFDRKTGRFLSQLKRAPAACLEGQDADEGVAKMEFLFGSSNLKLYMRDGTCECFNARSAQLRKSEQFVDKMLLNNAGNPAEIGAVSADNKRCVQLVSSGVGTTDIIICDKHHGKWEPVVTLSHQDTVVQVSFVPGTDHLLVIIREGAEHYFWFDLWDIHRREKLFGKQMMNPSFSFFPDRHFVAVYGDVSAPQDIHVWDLKQLAHEYKQDRLHAVRESQNQNASEWRILLVEDRSNTSVRVQQPIEPSQSEQNAGSRSGRLFAGWHAMMRSWGW